MADLFMRRAEMMGLSHKNSRGWPIRGEALKKMAVNEAFHTEAEIRVF